MLLRSKLKAQEKDSSSDLFSFVIKQESVESEPSVSNVSKKNKAETNQTKKLSTSSSNRKNLAKCNCDSNLIAHSTCVNNKEKRKPACIYISKIVNYFFKFILIKLLVLIN